MKFKTLKLITSHPLTKRNKLSALARFIKRGIVTRVCPYPISYPFIGTARLLIEKGMSSAELQIYTGLYDYHEMFFLLHILREDDLFIDVGANVGVFTILASKIKESNSIAIEPVPFTYKQLLNNIALNHISHKVRALNIGISDQRGEVKFTNSLNSAENHVERKSNGSEDCIIVPVNSLDNLLVNENPRVIKIDVEGFETMVINGSENVMKNESLKAIIIELNGLSEYYGFNEFSIHQKIVNNGFEPYLYFPEERILKRLNTFGEKNTIYIRDLEFLKERIHKALKFKILNNEY